MFSRALLVTLVKQFLSFFLTFTDCTMPHLPLSSLLEHNVILYTAFFRQTVRVWFLKQLLFSTEPLTMPSTTLSSWELFWINILPTRDNIKPFLSLLFWAHWATASSEHSTMRYFNGRRLLQLTTPEGRTGNRRHGSYRQHSSLLTWFTHGDGEERKEQRTPEDCSHGQRHAYHDEHVRRQ